MSLSERMKLSLFYQYDANLYYSTLRNCASFLLIIIVKKFFYLTKPDVFEEPINILFKRKRDHRRPTFGVAIQITMSIY